jgi:hypothetical protein
MNKVEELKSAIGKECSVNFSPTLRAKLIKVNKVTSTLEATRSPYKGVDNSGVGTQFKMFNFQSWNALFY